MAKSAARSKRDESYYNYINSGQYSYSSQAYKLEPYNPYEYEQEEASRPAVRPSAKPKTKARPVPNAAGRTKVRKVKKVKESPYKIEISNARKRSAMSFLAVAVIFAGAFLCVFSVAYADQKKFELTALQTERKELSLKNIALRGEILDGYDLAAVEAYATSELGMIKPQESQIIYITVPKTSYIVLNDVPEPEPGFSLLASIENTIRGILKTGGGQAEE